MPAVPAPLLFNKNGKKVRKPMRTALSSVPVASSARKLALEPPPVLGLAAVFWLAWMSRGLGSSHHSKPAAARPSKPSSETLACQLHTSNSKPTSAGIRVLPISPAKL